MAVFGLDVGGSGIKGAPVDPASGELLEERYRIPTPVGARPTDVVSVAAEVISHFDWQGPVGCGFPAVMKKGVAHTAANVSDEFIGYDFAGNLSAATSCEVRAINDADAAGIAEMRFGAGRDAEGVVLMLTLGTGIGTAIFTDGKLVPNTELGHIEIRGEEAEHRASDGVRKREDLSWKKWAERLQEYITTMENLFWPDLIVIGGGVSKKSEKFLPRLESRAEMVPAGLLNNAGLVGAALAAVGELAETPGGR
jgi:polyphosphate glucokinase